jgi:hypothetical protein
MVQQKTKHRLMDLDSKTKTVKVPGHRWTFKDPTTSAAEVVELSHDHPNLGFASETLVSFTFARNKHGSSPPAIDKHSANLPK